jgi:peptidoglycan/xylan/chitin deacetylase (PgdA/CDA1 family)
VVEGPLQLLAIAGAGQTAQLDALQAALDGPLREQRVVLDLISNASLLDLREALDAQQYHILHIAAAISISPDQQLMVAIGRGCEAFDLAELLANYPTLRLVTLSGAQGNGLHASAIPALLGAILMTEQIPATATIGWDLAAESSARALATLYDGLAAEAPLDLAATAGRRALQQAGEAGWGALQVRSLPGADQLFVFRPARPTPTQFEARRILPYAIAALVLVLLIVVGRALFDGSGNLPNSSTTATAAPNGFVLPLFPGQPPTPTALAATPTLEALPEPQGYVIATASFSDTLERLANQYASQPRGIAELNSLAITETLRVGRGLVIPVYQSGATNAGGLIVARGNPKQPNVALTFDIELDQVVLLKILDLLEARQIRATFFVTGSWVEAYPNAARAIVPAGHELGNHSYSHPYFSRLANEGVQNEIEETERIVREITGATTRPYFRFPYGDSTEDMLVLLGQEGYIAYHWSTDEAGMEQWLSQAAADPSSANGAILLMHGRADAADALNGWLDRIEALGLRVTTLSETLR